VKTIEDAIVGRDCVPGEPLFDEDEVKIIIKRLNDAGWVVVPFSAVTVEQAPKST
jgi:hypothetical protein